MEKVQALLAEMVKLVKSIIGSTQSSNSNGDGNRAGRYRKNVSDGDNSADDADGNFFGTTRPAFEDGDDTYGQGASQDGRRPAYRNRKKYSRT